jgi:hypothetical protein
MPILTEQVLNAVTTGPAAHVWDATRATQIRLSFGNLCCCHLQCVNTARCRTSGRVVVVATSWVLQGSWQHDWRRLDLGNGSVR